MNIYCSVVYVAGSRKLILVGVLFLKSMTSSLYWFLWKTQNMADDTLCQLWCRIHFFVIYCWSSCQCRGICREVAQCVERRELSKWGANKAPEHAPEHIPMRGMESRTGRTAQVDLGILGVPVQVVGLPRLFHLVAEPGVLAVFRMELMDIL